MIQERFISMVSVFKKHAEDMHANMTAAKLYSPVSPHEIDDRITIIHT